MQTAAGVAMRVNITRTVIRTIPIFFLLFCEDKKWVFHYSQYIVRVFAIVHLQKVLIFSFSYFLLSYSTFLKP
jgi:hypothetical protein